MILAIGSPALAGYSLAITRLNGRWLTRQFQYLRFPNKFNLPLALSALQHIPFRIDTSGALLPSLIVLHQNDRYWKLLGVAARRTRQWSIPVAMNIVWALVALLFTIVDSFVDFNYFITVPGDAGYSIAALWTFLLPVVVGWLHVGSQLEADHLRDALNDAHEVAYVATTSEPVLATEIPNRCTRAIEPSTRFIDHVNLDEEKTTPIFNYSRTFIWSQHAEYILRLYEHAANKAEQKITVRNGGEWVSEDGDNIMARDRVGNDEEVIQYCTEEPGAHPSPSHGFPQLPTLLSSYSAVPTAPNHATMPFPIAHTNANAPMQRRTPSTPSLSSKYDEEKLPPGFRVTHEKPVFATGVFHRVAFATFLALALQWGTTGAAVLIHLNTPPKGVGCRVLTFSIYGVAGTVAFLLLLLSSVLGHSVRAQRVREKRPGLKMLVGYIATLMRWLGKTIAILNGFGILVSCTMQFAGLYDNCFCSSSIFGGDLNGLVSFTGPNIRGSEVYASWIGGIVMAFGVSGLYIFAIYVATPAK